MDEYNLREFVNHEFIWLLIKIWSVDPEDNKQAGEKFLQNRLKKLQATEAAANEKEKDKDTEGENNPTPEQLLDYVPKNLRKMAEIFHQRIVERELEREKERERERERQLQEERERLGTSNEEEEDDDDKEEEEGEEDVTTVSKKKSTAATEQHRSANDTAGDSLTVRQSHHGGRLLRKTAADARSERTQVTKRSKKVPTQPKLADNATSHTKATSKKVKSEKERSTSLKGKEAKSTAAEVDSAPTPKKTSKAESGARSLVETDTKELEPQETYETELARIRQCEYVAGIFKKYEQFFKEPKTVKQTLAEVIETEHHADNEEGPKKRNFTLLKYFMDNHKDKSA